MPDVGEHHLSDYLAILRRRKRQVLGTAGVVFLISGILAFVIPPVYRSTATILIEQQEVPSAAPQQHAPQSAVPQPQERWSHHALE